MQKYLKRPKVSFTKHWGNTYKTIGFLPSIAYFDNYDTTEILFGWLIWSGSIAFIKIKTVETAFTS